MEPILADTNPKPPSLALPEEAELHLSRMRRRLGLGTLLLVLFLTFMDNTVISVTLANVQTTLHTGISQLQWVINGYALVFASFMLLFGTLGDQLGRKKVMLSGVDPVLLRLDRRRGGPERRHLDRGQGHHGARCRRVRARHALDDPPHLPRTSPRGPRRSASGRLCQALHWQWALSSVASS